ncbi:hypothetical protein BJY52DRAFT_1114341, partial [Lactarius psammicola]
AVFGGKVYNIMLYLAFHPGSEKELMHVTGHGGMKLNVDFILDACLAGFFISELSC